MQTEYINSVKKQFAYYKKLGELTFGQVQEKDLFWKYNGESNSIAIIVNHLWGNMLSRWTNFLTEDGEKEWRERDLEFEDVIASKEEMLQKWDAGWRCLFNALDSLDETNFHQQIYIRNQGHSVMEAINRQLAHYSYHIGQIVFLGTLLKGAEWKSLSIPKGASKSYNDKKFSKEKHAAHFTDEYLKPGKDN
ncbi:DUF1572 family protein [Galbibacter sp. PAP.153]|uniref:DUF1572 family protein n=1 Tax=Galbibacter sp. PAP.153 TaxID=3104623 RepID=UPI00300ADCBB